MSFFFSFDGVDGAGKSTQIDRFVRWLKERGAEVVVCRDPGGTPVGEEIRRILLELETGPIDVRTEMLLYMAARAQLVAEVIRPALSEGKMVVSDRFLLANVVYQGHAGGMSPDELWRIGETAVAGVHPALTFVLDMDEAEALARINREPDRMEARGVEFLRRVRAGFLAEAEAKPREILVVDAARPADEVAAEIRAAATTVLECAK